MTLKRTAALFVFLLLSRHPVIAQELVSHARELYVTANYEEALTALAAIEKEAHTVAERQGVREYRVLCLIALDRSDDAMKIIGEMIDADPFYKPIAERRPPRLITLFEQLRRQRLPVLGRELYEQATIAFDEHRNADAIHGFSLVLRLVEEAQADSTGEHAGQELTKLKTYTKRFLELVMARQQQGQAPAHSGRAALGSTDIGVTPPVPIRQEIPPWPFPESGSTSFDGELEVIIDEAGNVRETRITAPIHPTYDGLLLDSAKGWKYRPATKDGRPVTYRKLITISLMPQQRLVTEP